MRLVLAVAVHVVLAVAVAVSVVITVAVNDTVLADAVNVVLVVALFFCCLCGFFMHSKTNRGSAESMSAESMR